MMTLKNVTDKTSRGDGRQLFNFHKIYNSVPTRWGGGGIKTLPFYWLKSSPNSWRWTVNTNLWRRWPSRRDLNLLRQLGNFINWPCARPVHLICVTRRTEVDRHIIIIGNRYWRRAARGCIAFLGVCTFVFRKCSFKKYENSEQFSIWNCLR